ncbi:MAG: cytochrome c3 family protein [Methylovulum sp.]|nr:cytochrome c3 family protein [Methylovulum sp.]
METLALNPAFNGTKTRLNRLLSLLLLLLTIGVAHAEADNPHIVANDTPQSLCKSCHIEDPAFDIDDDELLLTKNNAMDPEAFSQDAVAMCSSCHDPENGHKVGLKIDFPVPADLQLGEKNDITCLTCHYTHGSLASDRPQASFSFMDKLMDDERLHKSFLLRRSNVDGELCLICHKVNEGSQ